VTQRAGCEPERFSGKDQVAHHGLVTTEFNISLVQGLAAFGRFDEGTTLMGETIQVVEANGDAVYMPKLLRLKGSLLLSKPQPGVADAELCFAQSLEQRRTRGTADRDGSGSSYDGQGQPERGRVLVRPVFEPSSFAP
jgi:hypothetical protein